MIIKKIIVGIFLISFLNSCAQNSAFLGPIYTFGTTGNCLPMDNDLVKKIETHNFDQIRKAEWRNSQLNFGSVKCLTESLHFKKPHSQLHRIIGASDEKAYERLISIPEIAQGINVPAQVKQLWDVCQVPDFRNLTIDTHIKLLQDL